MMFGMIMVSQIFLLIISIQGLGLNPAAKSSSSYLLPQEIISQPTITSIPTPFPSTSLLVTSTVSLTMTGLLESDFQNSDILQIALQTSLSYVLNTPLRNIGPPVITTLISRRLIGRYLLISQVISMLQIEMLSTSHYDAQSTSILVQGSRELFLETFIDISSQNGFDWSARDINSGSVDVSLRFLL